MASLPVFTFKGVSFKDILTQETILQSKSPQIVCHKPAIIKRQFDKIPTYFTDYETWPKKINLKCVNCTLDIIGVPIPIPRSANEINQYRVQYICCSFACAENFIAEKYTETDNKYLAGIMLKDVQRIFNENKDASPMQYELPPNFDDNIISSGFSRHELQQYGGRLTESQFRERVKKSMHIYNDNNE